jgi:hypothetical protein
VPRTSLVIVSALTLGDYALWNSSSGGGNDVIATISGLSLVPLVLATAWLLALALMRALAGAASPRAARVRRSESQRRAAEPGVARLRREDQRAALAAHEPEAAARSASSGKLAA